MSAFVGRFKPFVGLALLLAADTAFVGNPIPFVGNAVAQLGALPIELLSQPLVQTGRFPQELQDADGDGIADIDDLCAGSPRQQAVRMVDDCGCPLDPCSLDSDADGIVDCRDACAATAAKVKVGSNGCPTPVPRTQRVRLNLHFGLDSAVLTPASDAALDNLAQILGRESRLTLGIEGHTCDLGPKAYNKGLSQRRADAVRRALIDRGVAPRRLQARGYGDSRPLQPNDSESQRRVNRRVEALLALPEWIVPGNDGSMPPIKGTELLETPVLP